MTSTRPPVIAGEFADRERAQAFCQQVQRVHHRYATEVVGAFSLCPFMKDPATAFGCFCVMLDDDLDVDAAVAQVAAADGQVAHLIYPFCKEDSGTFERFANRIQQAVVKQLPSPPVHATFHPSMRGDRQTASRRVGMVRRAPDPFVQFVPDGLHEGGTSFLDPDKVDLSVLLAAAKPVPHRTLGELAATQLDDLETRVRDIRRDRNESYAPFFAAWGRST